MIVVGSTRYRWQLNGLLFGAAVGAGFAGFESAGYTFDEVLNSMARTMSVSVTPIADSIMWRGILAPGGHVIWTAMVGSAIWKVKGDKPFHARMLLERVVIRRWLIAVVLHGIWDTKFGFLDRLLQEGILFVVGWYIVFAILKQALQEVEVARGGV